MFRSFLGMGKRDSSSPPAAAEASGNDQAQPEAATPAAEPEQARPAVEDLAARFEQLSDEELRELTTKAPKLGRLVQAETDRREHKRRQEAEAQVAQARLQNLKAQERQVRQTDPYQAGELRTQIDQVEAQQEAERQASEQFGSLVKRVTDTYDASTLHPLVAALPEPERKALVEAAPPGLEGRKHLVEAAVEALKKQAYAAGKADADKELRKSAAFRKQVLAEARDQDDEPDLVPAGGPTRNGHGMNGFVRDLLRSPTAAAHR